MNNPFTLKDNKGTQVLSFGSVPVWNGVQISPGVKYSSTLELSAHNGPIKLCAPAKIIDHVVGAYRSGDYKFIAPPPGASDWADHLGQVKIQLVVDVYSDNIQPRNILDIGAGSTWVAKKLIEQYRPISCPALSH